MTTAATSLLGLALPVTGELQGTWGTTVNDSITSLLDTAVAGTTTLSTDADVTLTTTTLAANQARQAILLCSGARTALRTITAPAQSKIYTVINATTGGFSVKVVGVGPTTGVTIVAGESAIIAWNGSDFIKISNTGGSASFTNVTVSGTTTLSGLTASTALALNSSKEVISVTNTGTGNNVLSASPTLTGTVAGASLSLSSLTSGRVTYAGTSGLLQDSANLTFDGTTLTAGGFATGGSVTLSGGTANGVLYLNGSKVATSGSALTFNGVGLGIGVASATQLLNLSGSGTSNIQLVSTDSGGKNLLISVSGSLASIRELNGNPLGFDIGGSEAMRLTSTGLGIGTSSPSFKLDVTSAASYAPIRLTSAAGTMVRFDTTRNFTVNRNWLAGCDYISEGAFAIIPSTALGGSTFSNPVYNVSAAGAHYWYASSTNTMLLDSSGNLGLGVTPSAWAASALDIGGWSSFAQRNTNGWTLVGGNVYWDGSNYRYKNSSTAALYELRGPTGSHVWLTAASGTAGNAITFTQALTLDASGNLLCGNTSLPTSYGAASGVINTTGGVWTNRGQFTATGGSTTTFLTLANASNNQSYIVSVRQSGAGGNFVSAFVVAYGSNASAIRFSQDNTNPVLDMNITNSGLDIKLVLAAGFGSTTWDWVITRLG